MDRKSLSSTRPETLPPPAKIRGTTRASSLAALTALLVVCGCGTPFRDYTARPIDGTLKVDTLAQPQASPPPYRIRQGDVLDIRFYRNPELNLSVTVRPDGMVSLPFVDDVMAVGLPPAALSKELEQRFQGELANPDVTVIVTTFAGQRVFVGGEVDDPGEIELVSGMTVFQAIQKAGGFTGPARPEQVILIRKEFGQKPQGTSLDLTGVRDGEQPEDDVELQAFDIVFVPRSAVGNVNAFMEFYVTRNLPAGTAWATLFLGGGGF